MEINTAEAEIKSDNDGSNGLSYKFQRLRERLRLAVSNGELSGKLPGERQLARKFRVNAKTLSKALTDLAAEGLLDRSIGRGTFVKGAAPSDQARSGRYVIVCEPGHEEDAVVSQLLQICPKALLAANVAALRPSFLNQFEAVIDLTPGISEKFLRDMQVRGMRVVAVNREPDVHSVDTVAVDCALGAASMARDLILGGHRRIAVVESMARSIAGEAAMRTAARYSPAGVVSVCGEDGLTTALNSGATAIICDAVPCAQRVRTTLEKSGLRIGIDLSLAAIGTCDTNFPCSGQYVDCTVVAQTIADLLTANSTARPTMIWLAPKWVDRGTIGVVANRAGEAA